MHRDRTDVRQQENVAGGASANDNQPGFTGHLADKASGLVYMQQVGCIKPKAQCTVFIRSTIAALCYS
jgi:hypothetical protein